MRRLLAFVMLPVLLSLAVIGVAGAQRAMAAPLAGQGCVLFICLPDPATPSPSPSSASPSSAAPSPGTPSPGAAQPLPVPSLPVPVPGLPLPALPSAVPTAALPGGIIPSPGGANPAASASAAPKNAAAPRLVAAGATATLTAGTANITGFHYVGNAAVPTASGTQTMMEFTADSIDLTGNVTVTVTQDGSTVTTVSTSQDFSNGVTLYATQLSGSLQAAAGLPGVPLTLSPSTITAANLLKLPNAGELQLANLVTGAIPLTMTNVVTDQLLISGGTQVTTQLSMTNGS